MIRPKHKLTKRGFALIACLLMMVLLAVVAVGLLSLSTISLRSSSNGQAQRAAEANARLAVMIALGDLQKNLGDDRRVTANASILGTDTQPVARPQMVGVWESATTTLFKTPFTTSPSIFPKYSEWKTNRFKKWLVSSASDEETGEVDYARSAPGGDLVALFGNKKDGFDLEAQKIPIARTGKTGESSIAWAVIQEGDKAHISQPGDRYLEKNDVVQAPKHPNLATLKIANQPTTGWDARSAKMISLNQANLDPDYQIAAEKVPTLSTDFTVFSRGVLADVANGGLKTDLNLAFELSDSKFAQSSWDGLPNPFRSGSAEVPIHGQVPQTGGQPVSIKLDYLPSAAAVRYPLGSAATFDMLRSAYSSYRHLYTSGGTATAFFRPQVNKAWKVQDLAPIYPAPRGSETSVSPVLDRMLYLLSLWADSAGTPTLVITPVITLWNPYNVAIESSGYVAYPWMDIPIYLDLRTNGESKGIYLSQLIGNGKVPGDPYAGRQKDPYFYCAITGDGTASPTRPVRLEPGEIRTFVPSTVTPTPFNREGSDLLKTLRMKPAMSASDLKLTGGFAIDTSKTLRPNTGTTKKMVAGDTLSCQFYFQPDSYHYFTTLEDSTRITSGNPTAKGTVINEVQLYKGSSGTSFLSTPYTHTTGSVTPQLVGMLETYHRTARASGSIAESDIVHTVNTRQRYINSAFSGAKGPSFFNAGPHYNSSMRPGTDIAGLGLEFNEGKAYYGETNSYQGGKNNVILYDMPRQAPLSLASFQNADLADNAFSTSSQFANSWASPYVNRNTVGRVTSKAATPAGEAIGPSGLGFYDYSWLLNEALWDGYFLSSIAPRVKQRNISASAASGVYNNDDTVEETQSIAKTVADWAEQPSANPLRNSHMAFHSGGLSSQEVTDKLTADSGALRAAEHLMVEGSFNVNSTNEGAWRAILASLRGESFDALAVNGDLKAHQTGNGSALPRHSTPTGVANDNWNGFRELTDDQIASLAKEIVVEVRARGPFQSLSEFVNRRVENGELGLKGALQAAIDRSGLNRSVKMGTFDKSKFFASDNLPDLNTGIGIPGWLTQADLLGPIASIITVRSDTFRIRGYGEVRNGAGAVIAKATCEAVVQRLPEYVDTADKPNVKPANLTSEVNRTFGRRFEVVAFRMLSSNEGTETSS
ncbi:type II secretion system protein [Luteolibacter yonseiensis]|uniref:Type II secretion system protein n=1 Tax=Luteolibacter yonseiensis TaxID=1144680 RepID=A0A934V7K6_9BACT|nr:type II secretion system protein [Luteolibacter yonseiensis]MBK1816247.1 type II secretion system protein [Luteolibacter yonseiensis]